MSEFLGRVPAPGQPRWLPEDADVAVWWQVEQSFRCDGCGQDTRVSTTREADDTYFATPVRCHSCWAVASAAADGKEIPSMAGMRYRIEQC